MYLNNELYSDQKATYFLKYLSKVWLGIYKNQIFLNKYYFQIILKN